MTDNIFKVGQYLLFPNRSNSRHNGGDTDTSIRAIDAHLGVEYNCKILSIEQFHQYMILLDQLPAHPSINRIVQVVLGRRYAYLFYDRHCDDLYSYIRKNGCINEEDCLSIFRQIVQVVAHCHKHGIILNDLKLRKFLFMDTNRDTIVIDGLEDGCILVDPNDKPSIKHRCPAYVAPEMLQPGGYYSSKSADIWSLGVMFYTMVVGKYPFQDTDPNKLFEKIRNCTYDLPDTISAKSKCLIKALLRLQPEQRLTAEAILQHPWLYAKSFTFYTPINLIDRKGSDQTVPDSLMSDDDNTLYHP
ncbi:uncharacterized protein TRIADDRAFT_27641 [Trichoplax adhaerens]|uniref:Protein kinase domain-containing protein n=1 Tax=Trichoplax adhaerens TaxID=10228 RepID=B3S2A4_TRIAD|nr:hypothetical protein TRIADDRAFT_27641 [Trichoplax adhaerens]EDV23612.1 hypothetical protein TRIADDRAFT_27641 [Trichoplax adhaerens]|eukprot:XP_002114522.1 hypothetical protein TRIADDRAFT_27641 [Trichoplax adhaerens]